MILGFTGTRKGMTRQQENAVAEYLQRNTVIKHLNGACAGADREMFWLVINRCEQAEVTLLPGDLDQWYWARWVSSICKQHKVTVAKWQTYQTRNRKIVNGSNKLLATPKENHEIARSGTWSTVRIARKAGLVPVIVWPNGNITEG